MACRDKKHAIFVASDSPLTSTKFIENFVDRVEKYQEEAALIFPAVVIDGRRDRLGRHPLRMLNDTDYPLPGYRDSAGRHGFRLSALVAANPHAFDVNTANAAYSLRKLINPNAQLKLFKITRNLGYHNLYSKYFIRRDLSVKEVENITSAYFNGRLKLLPMLGEETTYDYDGTDTEFHLLAEMLNPPPEEPKRN
jgi:hypothetical protein